MKGKTTPAKKKKKKNPRRIQCVLAVSYKVKLHLPYDPAIQVLDIYPREMKIYFCKKDLYVQQPYS